MAKGRKRKIVTSEECGRLNSLRKLYSGHTFTYSQIQDILSKEIGWTDTTLHSLIINRIFVKMHRGEYFFPKDPIYIGKLQNIFEEIANKRHQKYMESKPVIEVEVVEISPIEQAIALLKANGYKVMKESFNLTEALAHPEKSVSEFVILQEI